MTSSRPYMIRALYEWIVDNNNTPYLLVDAHGTDVLVPQEHVNKEGQIVLNVAPGAVQDLEIGNDRVSFSARFGGIPTDIYVPCISILGIYARENGQGMIFETESDGPPSPPSDSSPGNSSGTGAPPGKSDKKVTAKKPSLRVVK